MCDRYVATLEGESPLRALVRRTVREGKGVHREVESEESRIQKCWPDEQEAHMRQWSLDKDAFESKVRYLLRRTLCRCDRRAGKCSELPGESCTQA